MFKNFPWYVVREFLFSIPFSFILFFISLGVLVSSAHAQTWIVASDCQPQIQACDFCTNSAMQAASNCGGVYRTFMESSTSMLCQYRCTVDCPSPLIKDANNQCVDPPPPPECVEPNVIHNGECITPVDEPQDCGITGFPIWIGSGYVCEPNFDTPCPEGTTNGMYTLPGYDPRPYCADASTPNSSSAGSASSSGQNSSASNSDGNDDGEGSGSSSGNNNSSSAPAGCPVPANSTCPNKYELNGQWYCTSGGAHCPGGGNSSSASSGSGGSASSAGAGECDPTAKDYLQCLDNKELVLPEETGAFDETVAQDKIAEAEAELRDVIDQIQSEIHDTFGTSLNGSGGLSDYCYNIMSVQVCFGWSRFSQYLTVIGQAILAAAYVAAFIIVMRQ